jgi:acyl dehydratase
MTVIGAEGLRAVIGAELGPSEWLELTPERTSRFLSATRQETATEDHVSSYFVLSLVGSLLPQILQVDGFPMGVNYGCNHVRFPASLPVGSRIRLCATVLAVDDIPGGVQTTNQLTFEIDGQSDTACTAHVLYRYYD